MIDHFKYTDKELVELISSMVILIDTREKKCEHITGYFDRKKVTYKKKALDFGDYSFMIPRNEAWIPNKHLEEDGTIKITENIDYVFRRSIRQLELAGITQPIIGIKKRTIK